MNEKTLEKVTGLSRRQIIMLQKTCIKRKNKIVVGISYEYTDDEVEQFILAKMFKDCSYNYPEIKKEMDNYAIHKVEVLDKAISKTFKKYGLPYKANELKEYIKNNIN